ncbi:MAG: pyrroline-5-carboxylate reductase [Candidatus Kerfeldbacteria bacterium]|nr:pyrroline-5-carboxylate reductase [Candidatus Kerfeldbacteria bacterium]
MSNASKRVAIVGSGTIGKILEGFLQADHQITMVNRQTFSNTQWQDFAIVCLAIKPQDFKLLTTLPLDQALVISVMTGITTTTLMQITQSAKVIRTMPNTPIKIGLGMTAWCKTPAVTQAETDWFQTVFSKVSTLLDVIDDDGIDKATAISASGPGFIFAMIEQYSTAAQALGLTKEQAELLVIETFFGAATLLKQSGLSAATLREQVTSKGGTTAAGLAAMGSDNQWLEVLQAAYQRAQELSQ